MKNWKKYSAFLSLGEWHIHTNYTDGDNSIDAYCEKAMELGIPLIAFTEHVRQKLNYDFDAFLEEIDNAREQYDLIILSGCETKVFPDGSLDVDENILKQVDYPIYAFHSFPKNIITYLNVLHAVMKNPHVNTWAHPIEYLERNEFNIPKDELTRLFKALRDNEVLLELNIKYGALPDEWIDLARRYKVDIVRGSDIHRVKDMKK